MTARRRYTSDRHRAIILERQGGRCATCPTVLVRGNYDIDHAHALALKGRDTLKNKRAICTACHDRKTFGTKATTAGSDIHRIAKVKRIRAGGRKRKGRAVSGSRSTNWKIKLNGDVVRRNKGARA